MANGDSIDSGHITQSVYYTSVKLIDGAVATDNGKWIDVRGFPRLSIDVSGITTATVQIHASNEPTKPADATNGRQIGANITADGIVAVDTPMRWIKAKVSAYTTGTILVYMTAVAL